jgi:hypothetical protein
MRLRHLPALLCSLPLACGSPGDTASSGTTQVTTAPPATTGGSTDTGDTPTTDAAATTTTTSAPPVTTSGEATTTDDDGSGGTTGPALEPDPPDPLVARRGVMHLHSPYSHDACDGDGLPMGEPNASCLADLRAALCATGLDFALLTDHPAHMQEQAFIDDLLYSEADGDQLVLDGDAPVMNLIKCPGDHVVALAVGYESTHTLPLGLHHHVAPEFYAGLVDADPLETSMALVGALKEAGAVVAIAHAEEEDLSAQRIVDVGLDAMEWYNPHGNFLNFFGGDSIASDPAKLLDLFDALTPFMAGSSSGAHADLVYLQLLPSWPQAGFDKWREVQRSRAVTGIFGSDVHQNVSIAPLCDQDNPIAQMACVAGAKALLPDQLDSLVEGGTIEMADGDRLDSYARIMRWLENRVLTPPGTVDLAALQDALRAGRNYGLFAVFGDPSNLRYFATDPGDAYLSMGDSAEGPLMLEVRAPSRPLPLHAAGPQWTEDEASAAEVRVELWRTDAMGSTIVTMQSGLGSRISHPASEPGAYHVEIWIRPQHLKQALGDQAALADIFYMWLITNPIVLE